MAQRMSIAARTDEPPHDAILVVDDEPLNRDLLSRRLATHGHRVVIAASGSEALDLVARGGIDLVLLDLEMPELSGLDVLATLRESYTPAQLPIILVTANHDSALVVEAIEQGANDYITKPIDFPVALARIRSQLGRKRAEEALRESEERYQLAVRGANDGLWDWKVASSTAYFSPRWKAIIGFADDELASDMDEWWRRVHPEELEALRDRLDEHLLGRTPQLDAEFRIRHKDGHYRWVRCRGVVTRDAKGVPQRMAGSLTDVTEAKLWDPLTGLPNRVLLFDRVARLVEQAKRRSDYQFSLLLVDVDELHIVNDSLGRDLGDQLLVEVAGRLERAASLLRRVRHDLGEVTVARVGGDEFVLLVEDVRGVGDAVGVAEQVLSALAEPLEIGGQEVLCTVTVGIAMSATRYDRADDLVRDAGTALRRAKSGGKSRYEIFDMRMREEASQRLQLERALRRALERDEFRLHYQPIVHLASGKVHGFEALVRWQHPEKGLLGPGAFIDLAEENGFIVPLGRWVLAEACRQFADWQRQFGAAGPRTINVNMSSQQFYDATFVSETARLIELYGMVPSSLELEVTENTAMANHEAVVSTFRGLKALGVTLSIDDFGTGYSSLSYLHRFPLNTLKVDRSFVSRLPGDPADMSIVRSIVTLAHSLGMTVVAEGVETGMQLQMLRALGCEFGQGYHFAQPLACDAATTWVAERLRQAGSPAASLHAPASAPSAERRTA
jgi:diguanylate cyclase (GGDEF)-like protein/PAS domain S-box-containing protein